MSRADAGASICCAQVATGGSSHEALPVLLLVPRLGDSAGGYSMLGYGDVVLPGLLLVRRTVDSLNGSMSG